MSWRRVQPAYLPSVVSHVSRRALNSQAQHSAGRIGRKVTINTTGPQDDAEDALRRKRRTEWKRRQRVSYLHVPQTRVDTHYNNSRVEHSLTI
jgi:hypothetical protein